MFCYIWRRVFPLSHELLVRTRTLGPESRRYRGDPRDFSLTTRRNGCLDWLVVGWRGVVLCQLFVSCRCLYTLAQSSRFSPTQVRAFSFLGSWGFDLIGTETSRYTSPIAPYGRVTHAHSALLIRNSPSSPYLPREIPRNSRAGVFRDQSATALID